MKLKLKKVLSMLVAVTCLCASLCVTAYAEETDAFLPDETILTYETASF